MAYAQKAFQRTVNHHRRPGRGPSVDPKASYDDRIIEFQSLAAVMVRKQVELMNMRLRLLEIHHGLVEDFCAALAGGVSLTLPPSTESLQQGLRRRR